MVIIKDPEHELVILTRNKINYLLIHNFKWEMDYDIPIEIVHQKASWLGRIKINCEKGGIPIHDLRTNKTFLSKYSAVRVQIRKEIYDAGEDVINGILLHELNHWYTYERYGNHVNAHGREFKHCGSLNNVPYAYNKASIPTSIHGIIPDKRILHTGLCMNCKKIVVAYARKSTVMTRVNKPYHTRCCHARIEYGGTKLYE
jgi:predicted SprT family Zn-dependent metalloprotease